MKYRFPFLLFLVFMLGLGTISAQCIVNTSIPADSAGIHPDPLPSVPACKFADMDVTFVFPRDTTFNGVTLPFLEFEITGITGLPQGMNWQCNLQPNCLYDLRNTNPSPDTVGCIRLFGTPTLPGTYPMSVDLNVRLPLVGLRQAAYPALMIVGGCERQGSCFDYTLNDNCAPTTVNLTNNISSNGNAGYSYDWNITGPNAFNVQTNLENPAPVSLPAPGEYIIQYTATVDTIGFVLDSIVIAGVSCDDDFGLGNPDLYWILTDPAGNVLINTSNNALSNVATPYTIGPLNTILMDTGTYVFEVWDEDSGLAGADDGCADGQNNGDADVQLNMATAVTGVNAIVNQGLTVNFHLSRPLSIEQCADTFRVDSVPPVPAVAVMGNATICEGDSVELMVSTTDSVQWYKDGQRIAGANTNSIIVKEAGDYAVETIYTSTLCFSRSAEVTIDVVDLARPAISLSGTVFSVNMPVAGLDYTWLRNGSPVGVGITQPGGASGYYSVFAIDPASGCRSDTSDAILYTAVGLDDLVGLAEAVQVFPNPNHGSFSVKADLPQASAVQLRLVDLLGRTVYTYTQRAGTSQLSHQVQLVGIRPGMYLLQLEIEGNASTTKVVVQ